MQSRAELLSLAAAGVAALFSLTSCGGGGSSATKSGNGNTVSAVTVYPTSTSVPVSGIVKFTAFLPSATTTAFTWKVSGGGAIDSSTGVYTAPASPPSPATVTVTATPAANASLSGTATISITSTQGVMVSPGALAIQAGTTQTFTATVNGAAVAPTWEVNGVIGGDAIHGTIDGSGSYTAPLTPPATGSATITAVSGTASGTAMATVIFSDNSLNGLYAFSYTGDDGSGLLAVGGSFAAQGSTGTISNGVEDRASLGSGPSTQIPFSGTFSVNPDGSGTATLGGGAMWKFTLTSDQQGGAAQLGLLVRFDNAATGSGTINVQNPAFLTASAFSGNFVFGVSGTDRNGNPLAIAGRFSADGVGAIPPNSAEEDINFAGTNTMSTPDKSLQGTFALDSAFGGSNGRGTVTLTSTDSAVLGSSNASFEYAFYIVDDTHLKVVEIDGKAFLAGDFYSAANTPATGAFTAATALPTGNYAFTAGGSSGSGAYAAGGVFVANGGSGAATSGSISGGVLDVNSGGVQIRLGSSLTSSSYSVDTSLGRILLPLTVNGGGTANFAVYRAAYNTPQGPVELLEMVEVDRNQVASGIAYPQTGTNALAGGYGLDLAGIANVKGGGAVEQDLIGQLATLGGTSLSGTLNINNFALTTTTSNVPLTIGSMIAGADSNGRGTLMLNTNVGAPFALAYYIGDNGVLLLETDSTRVANGVLNKQF
jgi:hypothetical protein